MKTTAEKIAVMQAFEQGKKIEVTENGKTWVDIDEPKWDWATYDYRINQEKWNPSYEKLQFISTGELYKAETDINVTQAAKQFKFNLWFWHLANELNEGWVPDWDNEFERKYTIQIIKNKLGVKDFTRNFLTPVFKNHETAQKAIKIMSQWDWYFGENHD